MFAGLFALGFGVPGLLMTWFLLFQPLLLIVDARSWEPTTCTIQSSAVEPSSEGDTYRIVITYTYAAGGTQHSGSRYDFGSQASTSGYREKAAIVDSLPPGGETDCWFDPEEPSQSVIVRDAGAFLVWGLIALPFLLVGLVAAAAFVSISRTLRRGVGAPSSGHGTVRNEPALTPLAQAVRHQVSGFQGGTQSGGRHLGSLTDRSVDASALGIEPDRLGGLALEPKTGRWARTIGLLIMALFWNGIVAVVLWRLGVFEGRTEDGCFALFMIPFGLVGILLLLSSLHQVLNLANPQPHLRLDTARPMPGQPAVLEYRLTGSTRRLDRFEIRLLGKEVVTYRRGTSTNTSRHTFHDQELVSLDRVSGGLETVQFDWPEGAMPTFIAASNRVEWSLEVSGSIRFWPDIAESFPVPIYPPEHLS